MAKFSTNPLGDYSKKLEKKRSKSATNQMLDIIFGKPKKKKKKKLF